MLVIVTAVIITKQVNSSGKRCSKKMQQKSRLVMFSHLLLIVLQHSVSMTLGKSQRKLCAHAFNHEKRTNLMCVRRVKLLK